jgi:hypothetical protein
MKKAVIIILLLAFVFSVSAADLWEYKVDTIVINSYMTYLNIKMSIQGMLDDYSGKGWELSAITQYQNVLFLSFKRVMLEG